MRKMPLNYCGSREREREREPHFNGEEYSNSTAIVYFAIEK